MSEKTNWVKGDVVELTQMNNGIQPGTFIVARGATKAAGHNLSVYRTGESGQTISLYTDYIVAGQATVEDFENKVKELETEIRIVKSKVKWMSENSVEKYDELQFKIWNTLQIVKDEKDSVKAAKLISELFK